MVIDVSAMLVATTIFLLVVGRKTRFCSCDESCACRAMISTGPRFIDRSALMV